MKRFFLLLAFFAVCSLGAQAQNDVADRIALLLKSGNTTELSEYLMPNVDLTVLNTDDLYSKAQATQIIKKFFDENPPRSFVIKHQGKSKLDDHYRIGTLTTAKGEFRVTYFLKNTNNTFLIKQLRIESNESDF
jgi:hypothetical protein